MPDAVLARESAVRPNDFGKPSFRLEDAFDLPDLPGPDSDTLSKYLWWNFPQSVMDVLKEDLGIAKFWLSQVQMYPDLCSIALRFFATPVSSASSEGNFSAINRILSSDRSRLKSNFLEYLLYARSSVQNDSSGVLT